MQHIVTETRTTATEPPPELTALASSVSVALADRVPFDALSLGTTDPSSRLVESGLVQGTPIELAWRSLLAEYTVPDVNKLAVLAGRRSPVGLLSEATGGDLLRSYRYRAIHYPRDIEHELRVALRCQGVCWGYLELFRSSGRPDFSTAEVEAVRSLAANLTGKLMDRALSTPVGRLPPDQVGVVNLDTHGRIEAINDTGRGLLERLGCQRCPNDPALPLSLRVLAAQLSGNPREQGRPRRMLLLDPNLGWLRIDGTRQQHREGRIQVTATLQRARPMQVAPFLLAARGVTPRAVQVVMRVLRGMTSAEIAEELKISRHTVQDHLRPVFSALAVNSRRQLVSSLFPYMKPYELR